MDACRAEHQEASPRSTLMLHCPEFEERIAKSKMHSVRSPRASKTIEKTTIQMQAYPGMLIGAFVHERTCAAKEV